jgi:hypothetical protein
VARGRGYGGGATPARQRSMAPTRLACDEEWPACFVARSISGGDERRCASCPCESSTWWRTAAWVRRIIKHNLKSNNNLETDAVYTTCINEFCATSLSIVPLLLLCVCALCWHGPSEASIHHRRRPAVSAAAIDQSGHLDSVGPWMLQ